MRAFIRIISALSVKLALCASAMGEVATPKSFVLITNANMFDGQNEKLAEGNKITKIAKFPRSE